jgi:hypothetical protein
MQGRFCDFVAAYRTDVAHAKPRVSMRDIIFAAEMTLRSRLHQECSTKNIKNAPTATTTNVLVPTQKPPLLPFLLSRLQYRLSVFRPSYHECPLLRGRSALMIKGRLPSKGRLPAREGYG